MAKQPIPDPANLAANILGEQRSSDVQEASLLYALRRQMAKVPGFQPPGAREEVFCPMPPPCSGEEQNEYRSAGVLLNSLAAEFQAWRETLPPEYMPAIIAVLHGGIQIQVSSLAQVSFDGIRVEGLLEGKPCSLLAHQDTIQLLCFAEEVQEEQPPRPIGFIWPDRNLEV